MNTEHIFFIAGTIIALFGVGAVTFDAERDRQSVIHLIEMKVDPVVACTVITHNSQCSK